MTFHLPNQFNSPNLQQNQTPLNHRFPGTLSIRPGPHLAPVQRPINRSLSSRPRHSSGGTLKKAQGPPHHHGCAATQARQPGKDNQTHQTTINGIELSKMGENVIESAAPEETPFHLTDVDKWVLSQTDETFKCHDWEELREILGTVFITPSRISSLSGSPKMLN